MQGTVWNNQIWHRPPDRAHGLDVPRIHPNIVLYYETIYHEFRTGRIHSVETTEHVHTKYIVHSIFLYPRWLDGSVSWVADCRAQGQKEFDSSLGLLRVESAYKALGTCSGLVWLFTLKLVLGFNEKLPSDRELSFIKQILWLALPLGSHFVCM